MTEVWGFAEAVGGDSRKYSLLQHLNVMLLTYCPSHAGMCTSCITQNTIESGGMIRGFVMFQCFGLKGGSDPSGLRRSSLPLRRMRL